MGKNNIQSMFCGEIFSTPHGYCRVVKYEGALKVTVQFDDGTETVTSAGHIRRGVVGNPMHPITYGVGYFGIGRFCLKHSPHRRMYSKWSAMLQRCYDAEHQLARNPTYVGCSVSEDWKCFQNYARDYCELFGKNSDWDMDKDLLFKGNKVYSKETCVALPRELNVLTVGADAARGKYPKGVCWKAAQQKFHAYCTNGVGKQQHLGYYHNCLDAFAAYKKFKEQRIKSLAEKWKSQIDPRAYDALMNYQVLITD